MRQFSWLPLPEGYHLVAAELLTGGPALPGAACLVGIRPAARRMWPASPGLSRAGAGLARRSAGRSGRTGPAGRLAYRAVRCGAGRGEGLVIELEALQSCLIAVLTKPGPSLTNTQAIAVLLTHEVCTAMIHTHERGLDWDSRAKLAAQFIEIFTAIQTAPKKVSLLMFTSVAAL
jgi:hypothetical protein